MLWICLLALSCEPAATDDSASPSDASDTDTDTDADADTDADTDVDTDVDTSSLDALPDDFCERSFPTDAPAGPACLTGTLSCGDSVDGTLVGGRSEFDAAMYALWYCTPNLDLEPYDGPERVYAVELPAHTHASFVLQTPCADLDVFALYWPDADTCPDVTDPTRECDAGDGSADIDVAEILSVEPERDLVVVDGREGEQANFRLTVLCE